MNCKRYPVQRRTGNLFRWMIVSIVNFILKGTKLMTTVADLTDGLNTVIEGVTAVDTKLDDVRALVETLKAGTVTQEQLDALGAKLTALKTATSNVVTEVSGIV